jgi:nucleotide-binding universal stress UspA family protein
MGRAKRGAVIVCATDFSAASRGALAQAVAFAQRARARLAVIHVLMPPSPFASGEPPRSWVELEAAARRDAERRLDAAVAAARRAGLTAEGKLIEGIPAESIANAARRIGAQLVVIGTHGRSGLGRLFMGSVASGVLHLASCPVLTVRGRTRAIT